MRYSSHMNVSEPSSARDEENQLVAELRQLKHQRSARSGRVARALGVLEKTNSTRVRNAAAVALADLRARETIEKLLDLLANPKTRGARGSILYALDQLRANVPLTLLVEIIATEPYEAREEALGLIASNSLNCSAEEFARARSRLETAIVSADIERKRAIGEAMKLLNGNAIRM
jgi:HEAT repeat protein